MDSKDVRAGKTGAQANFPDEALRPDPGGDLGAKHLDRHRALMPEITSQVNRGHAPAPELPLDHAP